MWTRGRGRTLIGVVHLLPLPGAPRPSPGLREVRARAVADARALLAGGVDGVIVENLGDAPFSELAEGATIAAMTRIGAELREVLGDRALGINVLRNDALGALAVAAACEADFIRVNILSGAMVTDQGWIEGRARALALERNRLGAGVRFAADVLVKHATPIGAVDLVGAAHDLAERAGADAVIVSGRGTGQATDAARVALVASAIDRPVWVGSGARLGALDAVEAADGAIVGTTLHVDERLDAPVDVDRVRAVRRAIDALPPR